MFNKYNLRNNSISSYIQPTYVMVCNIYRAKKMSIFLECDGNEFLV